MELLIPTNRLQTSQSILCIVGVHQKRLDVVFARSDLSGYFYGLLFAHLAEL